MKLSSKFLIAAISVGTLSGTAFAQGEEGGEEGGDMGGEVGGEAGAEVGGEAGMETAPPPGDPAAMDPAAGGGKGAKTIGVDVGGIFPLSDYGDAADFAVGGFGRFEFGINDMLSVTARVGVQYHIGTPEGFSLLFIPILAGVKYKIGTSGLFAHAEAGLNYARISVDVGGMSASDSETDFGAGAGVGYQMGKIQIRGGLLLPDVGEAGDAQGIMATVGYDVAAL